MIFSRIDLPINTRSMNVLCELSATKEYRRGVALKVIFILIEA